MRQAFCILSCLSALILYVYLEALGYPSVSAHLPVYIAKLVLHGLNSLLIYGLTLSLLQDLKPKSSQRWRWFVAALTSLIFAAHPLQTEALLWLDAKMLPNTAGLDVLAQPQVWWRYISLFFWPQGLSFDHDIMEAASAAAPALVTLFWGAHLVVIALAYGGRRRWPLFATGAAIFYGASILGFLWSPSSEAMQESRAYLSLWGLSLLVAGGVGFISQRLLRLIPASLQQRASWIAFFKRLDVQVLGLVIFMSPLAVASSRRSRVWVNSETLWRHVVFESPRKERGYLNLVEALRQQPEQPDDMSHDERYRQILGVYLQLLAVKPNSIAGRLGLARTYLSLGQIDDCQKTLASLRQSLAAVNKVNMTKALTAEVDYIGAQLLARLGDLQPAIANLQRILVEVHSLPQSQAARSFWRDVCISLSLLQLHAGDFEGARSSLQLILAQFPADLDAILLLADIEAATHQDVNAETIYQRLAKTHGATEPRIQVGLAETWVQMGRIDEAERLLRNMLREPEPAPLAILSYAALLQERDKDKVAFQVLGTDADIFQKFLNLSATLEDQGDYRRATKVREKAKKLCLMSEPPCGLATAFSKGLNGEGR